MIEKLTLEEKVGQMFMFGINKQNTEELLKLIKQNKIGGVILYKKNYNNYEEMITLIKRIKHANQNNKIPLLLAIDQEGGVVNRMPKEFKNLKSITKASKTNNLEIIKEHANIIGNLLTNLGINTNFSPVLDLDSNIKNKALKERCISNNESKVIEYGITYEEELKKHNIISVIKHFPGHGSTKKRLSLPTTICKKLSRNPNQRYQTI